MRQIKIIIAEVRRALAYKSLPQQIIDLIRHKLKINTNFRDYYRFEFYKSDASMEEKSLYLGPNGSRYWPFEGNSLYFDRLFVIKSLQKSLLMGAELPTPKMLFKVGQKYPINTLDKFAAALRQIKVPILTKFDGGGGGVDIFALDPAENGFLCDGNAVDAEWIWNKYASRMARGFFVEERIYNHPDLAALNPDSLNTLRLMVVKTANGQWHFLKPLLKIGRAGSAVDNLSMGGMFSKLDENGVAGPAYCKYDDTEYDCHPDTGEKIIGFQVPYYREALELAEFASQTVGFMGTLAWDMGVTPDGPMIIEANAAWRFEALQQRLGPLLTPEIAAGLHPRSWWLPWDKTHMYPKYFTERDRGWRQQFAAKLRQRWEKRLRARAGS